MPLSVHTIKPGDSFEPYVVREAHIPLMTGKFKQRWYIYRKFLPVLEVNYFLNNKSQESINTGKTYAYRLVIWFNYIQKIGKCFVDASIDDVLSYIDYLIYGTNCTDTIMMLDPKVTFSYLKGCITVIQEFYRHLDGYFVILKQRNLLNLDNNSHVLVNHNQSLRYSNIYDYTIEDMVDINSIRFKPTGFKKHWLSEYEKISILNQFSCFRDKAIFMLTLEGMRIDEVLSIKYSIYDKLEQTVRPSRSKGCSEGYEDKLRLVAFSDKRTAEYLDNYINTERAQVESDLEDFLEPMFINIKKTPAYGHSVSYRNYWEILKRAVSKSGIDPKEIATHVGRRTKVQELLEDGEDDEVIRQIIGWASADMIETYRNHNSKVIIKAAAKRTQRKRNTQSGKDIQE